MVETLPPDADLDAAARMRRRLAANVAICDLGDIAGGDSVELVFTATPGRGSSAGRSSTSAEAFIGDKAAAVVDRCRGRRGAVPAAAGRADHPDHQGRDLHQRCSCPGRSSYLVTVENVGPGDAINVQFTDELPPARPGRSDLARMSAPSPATPSAASRRSCPDGVFEVVEIFGTVDGSDCGTIDNSASIAWEGGTQRGLAIADAAQIEITGLQRRSCRPTQSSESVIGGASVIGARIRRRTSARVAAAAETCRTPASTNRCRP